VPSDSLQNCCVNSVLVICCCNLCCCLCRPIYPGAFTVTPWRWPSAWQLGGGCGTTSPASTDVVIIQARLHIQMLRASLDKCWSDPVCCCLFVVGQDPVFSPVPVCGLQELRGESRPAEFASPGRCGRSACSTASSGWDQACQSAR